MDCYNLHNDDTGSGRDSLLTIIMANKMNWGIWKKKVLLTTLAVLIAGGISIWQDNQLWLILLPALKAIENYWKHH